MNQKATPPTGQAGCRQAGLMCGKRELTSGKRSYPPLMLNQKIPAL
jgi:hypothetical protein